MVKTMADILIRGMEMPKSCFDCDCAEIYGDGYFHCNRIGETFEEDDFRMTRHPDCPLIEVPIDYNELLKAAQAMHTWIFLHSGNEKLAYKACGLSDEMDALLGYSGSYTVTISADKDGEQ